MTRKEKDELKALREEIGKLREEVRQSRGWTYIPYPVYPQPWVAPYVPYQPYPYSPTITWGNNQGTITTYPDDGTTTWVDATPTGATSFTSGHQQ